MRRIVVSQEHTHIILWLWRDMKRRETLFSGESGQRLRWVRGEVRGVVSHHVEGDGRRSRVALGAPVQGGVKRGEPSGGRGHNGPMGAGRRLDKPRLSEVPRWGSCPPSIDPFGLYGCTDGTCGEL